MIRIMLGNPGSGKTACMVRELTLNPSLRKTFSNIITKHIPNNIKISGEMIFDKEVKNIKRDGEVQYKYKLNVEFWKSAIKKHGAINVVIDEAHTIFNARRSATSINIIMGDFLALIRRILGSNESGGGEMIFITQLEKRIDVIAREQATNVRYHVCHYLKHCGKCGFKWQENNESPEIIYTCPACSSPRIKKYNHVVEVWEFVSMTYYYGWKSTGRKFYFKHYYVKDIEKYFPSYDTMQWESLISMY